MQPYAPDASMMVDVVSLSQRIKKASEIFPRKTQWRLFIMMLLTSDILMNAFAFRLAYLIRFETNLRLFRQDAIPTIEYYRLLVVILIPVWLTLFGVTGIYDRQNLLGGTREYAKIFRSTTVGLLLVIVAGFLEPDMIIARGWLLLAWFLTFFFTALGRFGLRRLVYWLRQYGYFLTPAVIVGANQEGRWLAEQLLAWKTSGLHVVGFVDKKVPVTTPLFHNLCSLGTVDQLDVIIQRYQVGELILASSAISSRDWLVEIFKNYGVSDDVNVRMSSGLYEIITTGLTVNEVAYVPLVHINKVRLTGLDNIAKFILDFAVTIPGLILASPIILLLAILVKLDSKGPVIHKRYVMGINGKQFPAYKFRTMYVNGDEILESYPDLKLELAKNHKLKDDPRITRVGKILRKYSLDELPQLFNVLKREMSLVGPRMITPEEMEKYDKWDINLLTVRPGITGLWQVSGRSDVSYDERVQLDMFYVRNWTIWLDIQLLMQTPTAVIKGRGAY